jgi:hypothetical protein
LAAEAKGIFETLGARHLLEETVELLAAADSGL